MSELQQEKSGLAMKARHAAVRRLIAAHKVEYTEMHAEEREALGLPALVGGDQVSALRIRIAELEAELRKKEGK